MNELNKWHSFRYYFTNELKSDLEIKAALTEFIHEVITPLKGKNTICFMFKIQTDQGFKSITHLQEFNINKFPKAGQEEEWLKNYQKNIQTLNDLLNLCQESWYLVSDRYQTFLISYIVFSYKVIPSEEVKQITKKVNLENKFRQHAEALIVKPEAQVFKNHHLPTTMDFTQWGEYELSSDFKSAIVKKTSNKNKGYKIEYHIKLEDYKLLVDLKVGSLTAFSWVDTLVPELGLTNLSTFKRTIKKNTYYFEDGQLQLHTIEKSCRKITTVNKSTYRSKNFITYDIETKTIDGLMVPYCVCLYDGANHKIFYITDYDNLNLTIKEKSDIMLKDSILFLLKPQYSGYKVYAHNFSYFDGIFLMKFLTEVEGVVKPVIRDGKFIETKIFYNWKDTTGKTNLVNYENISNENIFKEISNKAKNCKYNISFRDSLLLLPAKLSLLAKTFGVANKDLFPYKFINLNTTTFDYEGPMPSLQYYNVLDLGDDVQERLQTWRAYKARFNNKNKRLDQKWNLKNETILYCKNDVKILWEILDKYSKIIFENWFVDLMKSPTISSLAFKLFRSNYLQELDEQKIKIPAITGKIYDDIKKSYTGGAVDVYKPYGENIKVYDVKSLYPSVMLNNPMPVGNPTYFEGNILKNKDYWTNNENQENNSNNDPTGQKPFGFFYVKVQAPKEMKEPILQMKRKINNLTRTIAPIGSWKGWYFSEELYNAEKYGYKFNILRGYTFNKGYIFPDYVDTLYKIKCNSEPGTAMYTVSKLLLNSLYGRLGMSPLVENHSIIESSKSNDVLLNEDYTITNVVDLQNGKELISYFNKNAIKALQSDEGTSNKNISIAIASAVTAYARIKMSHIKMDKNIKIYYSDTDSFVVDKKLNGGLVSEKLGDFKLENNLTF